jgi:hypothetical protein
MAWRKANDYNIATISYSILPNLCKSNHSMQIRFIKALKLHALFTCAILCSLGIKLKLVSKFMINLYKTSYGIEKGQRHYPASPRSRRECDRKKDWIQLVD